MPAVTDPFAGQVMLGACASTTVTVKEHVPVLPAASVALKTLVVGPSGYVPPLAIPLVWVLVTPAQLSVPEGVLKVATPEQSPEVLFTLRFAGQVMVGACTSDTVTLKEHVAVRPWASVTRKVFTVVPTGKDEPLARPPVCEVEEPGQLSVPTGAVNVPVAAQSPVVLVRLMLAGQVMDGLTLSTVMITSSEEAVQGPLEMVHLSVVGVPETRPVTVLVGLDGVVTVPGPLTMLQAPEP